MQDDTDIAGRLEMVPRAALMCLPMKVAVGRGSRADLWLIRKPADWSWVTAVETVEESVAGEEDTKVVSSTYYAVCEADGSMGGGCGERWRWITCCAKAGACDQPKGVWRRV